MDMVRALDARFLLCRLPRTVHVPHDVADEVLEASGLERRRPGELADWAHVFAVDGSASHARSVTLRGDARRALLGAGLPNARLVHAMWFGGVITLAAPLDDRDYSPAAFVTWNGTRGRLSGVKRIVKHVALSQGRFPWAVPVTVAEPASAGPDRRCIPAFIGAAAEAGMVPSNPSWFLALDEGPAWKRGAFLVADRGARVPSAVVKFSRIVGDGRAAFAEERAAHLVAELPPEVARAVPSWRGRFELGGHHATVEDAAVGTRLDVVIAHQRRDRFDIVDRVATWAIEKDEASAGRRSVIVDGVPEVVVHGDLHDSNVIVGGDGGLKIVDWELAHRGLPLSDLALFAVHALARLDGANAPAELDRHFVDLFSGRAASSPRWFSWLRAGVRRLQVPPDAVGMLMQHTWEQAAAIVDQLRAEHGSTIAAQEAMAERARRLWLSQFGSQWSAWRS